mgnify:CR=1 FL=1
MTSGQSKKPQRQRRICAIKKKKEAKHVTFVNFAMFYYIKVTVLSDITL